jgi:Txe/YoeB family toxin of Txe-Axe toxin-antitoxin module
MKLEFLPSALDAYKALKVSNPERAAKIKEILRDTLEHPDAGQGEPTRLSGQYLGVWMRRLSVQNELYYIFDSERVVVISFSRNEEVGKEVKTGDLNLQSFSEDEYASVMALMSANRGKDNEPKVGIFWYNRAKNELFGVVSHKVSDYSRANASDGRITCSEMHEDIWKQKYHGNGEGPFVGAYQDKPRGRVFYNMDTDTYEVAVGKWLEDYPQAYDLILEEFNLPKEKTAPKYAIHWDIGMSWR